MPRNDQTDGREFPWQSSGFHQSIVFTTSQHEVMVGPIDQDRATVHFCVRRRDGQKTESGETGAVITVGVGETGVIPWVRCGGRPVFITLTQIEYVGGRPRVVILATRPSKILAELIKESLRSREIAAGLLPPDPKAPQDQPKKAAEGDDESGTVVRRDKGTSTATASAKGPHEGKKEEPTAAEQTRQDGPHTKCIRKVRLNAAERHLIRTALGVLTSKVMGSPEDADVHAIRCGVSNCSDSALFMSNWINDVAEKIGPP